MSAIDEAAVERATEQLWRWEGSPWGREKCRGVVLRILEAAAEPTESAWPTDESVAEFMSQVTVYGGVEWAQGSARAALRSALLTDPIIRAAVEVARILDSESRSGEAHAVLVRPLSVLHAAVCEARLLP